MSGLLSCRRPSRLHLWALGGRRVWPGQSAACPGLEVYAAPGHAALCPGHTPRTFGGAHPTRTNRHASAEAVLALVLLVLFAGHSRAQDPNALPRSVASVASDGQDEGTP